MTTKPDLRVVDSCSVCGGRGTVMSEYALQTSGNPEVDCPEGGWSDEPTNLCELIRPATTADLVAALIAEGGETIWWCEEHRNMGTDNRCWRSLAMAFQVQYANVANGLELESPNFPDCHMVERLVFPIPAEEETTT